MTPDQRSRWNNWAAEIARAEVKSWVPAIMEPVGKALGTELRKRDDRIGDLEARVKALEAGKQRRSKTIDMRPVLRKVRAA